MRCRYCNQRLNFFKSLSGSSFCSQEHQKLYEKAQANTAFERLLEFVEKEDKPAAGPGKPSAPSAEPPAAGVRQEALPHQVEPAIPAAESSRAESPVAKEQEQEPPFAAFLFGPIAAPAKSPAPLANFEIQAPDFPPPAPALPAWNPAILTEQPEQALPASQEPGPLDLSSPPPMASWSAFPLAGIDTPQASGQVPSVGPVRPRAATLEIPSPQSPGSAAVAASFLISENVPVHTIEDNREVAQLARLIPLQRDARSPQIAVQPMTPGTSVAALAQAHGMELSASSSNSSASTFFDPPTILTPRMQFPALPETVTESRPPTRLLQMVADLPLGQSKKHAPVAMQGAMTRAVAARAVLQPQLAGRAASSGLHKSESVTGVSVRVQNIPGPRNYAVSPSLVPPRDCVVPAARSQAAAIRPRLTSLAAHAKFHLRENDRSPAVLSPEVPDRFAIPSPRISAVGTIRNSVGLARDLMAHTVAARVHANDGSVDCAFSPARSGRQECLLPGIGWSAKAGLPWAGVSSGWFRQTDHYTHSFQAGAPAERRFVIRLAPSGERTCRPTMAFHRKVRRLVFETREWSGEQAKLQHARPSATSPLALVVRPQAGMKRTPVQPGVAVREFASIAYPAKRGRAPSNADRVSWEELKLTISLPASINSQWPCAFRTSRLAEVKSPAARPADGPDARVRLEPSAALRIQPASMLVLPQSQTARAVTKRMTSVGWATVIAPSVPDESPAQVASSEECSLPSLRRLADALRIEMEDPALRLNPSHSAMSLESGIQTSPLAVPAANALPRRRGPQLPVVTAQLGGLVVGDR